MSPRKRLGEDPTLPQPLAAAADVSPNAAGPGELASLHQMARGLVHDFNNALSPVLGYAELLLEDSQLLGKQRHCVERIEAGALRAVEILRRLDLFYRDTHNRGLIEVPVAELVREILAQEFPLLLPADSAATANCRLELDDSLHLAADAAELRILLMQLLTNAVEASVAAKAPIVVRWCRQDRAACLEITDSGVGMSPELCRVCREPFQTTKSEVGTGLGLSMCHGIVRRLSGTMEVHSVVGRGTTVRIVLPT